MATLDDRVQQLADRLLDKRYNKKKDAIISDFETFLKKCDENKSLILCTPKDILRFLVFRDTNGKTQIHKVSCPFLGQTGLHPCGCAIRLSAGTVSNIISQLKAFFQSVGMGDSWSVASGKGNPAAAPQVMQYLMSTRHEQAEAHIVAKQAKPLFLGKLLHLCQYWHNELEGYLTQKHRFIILRDRAFFTLQFFAGDRASDLTYLVGQEVKLLKDGSGVYIRLTFGKQWRGEDHNDFVILRCKEKIVCPISALESYNSWCKNLGEDITKGYVFRLFPNGRSVIRMTSNVAYKQLKSHLRAIALDDGETPHGIRAGNSISLLLGGVDDPSIMSHVGWKSQSTFSHYTRQSLFGSVQAAQSLSKQTNTTSCIPESHYNSLDRQTMQSFFA